MTWFSKNSSKIIVIKKGNYRISFWMHLNKESVILINSETKNPITTDIKTKKRTRTSLNGYILIQLYNLLVANWVE